MYINILGSKHDLFIFPALKGGALEAGFVVLVYTVNSLYLHCTNHSYAHIAHGLYPNS